MRKAIAGFGLVVTAATVAACGDAPTAPPVAGPQMAAVTESISLRVPLDRFVFVECADEGAGESVHLLGTLHIVNHIVVTSSGVTGVRLFNPQGVSGTGMTTGRKYQGIGVTQEVITEHEYAAETITFVNNFRIMGQGPGNDLVVHIQFHLTDTPTGYRVTAAHAIEECR
jgi:hypothetical protein